MGGRTLEDHRPIVGDVLIAEIYRKAALRRCSSPSSRSWTRPGSRPVEHLFLIARLLSDYLDTLTTELVAPATVDGGTC